MFAARMSARWLGMGARWSVVVALYGCGARDRLTFTEPPLPGTGPKTTISQPAQSDTIVPDGPGVFVVGQSRDDDGVETIIVETVGGVTTFPPLLGGDTLEQFALPITTNGQHGQTITVRIYAIDRAGVIGDTAMRRIIVN